MVAFSDMVGWLIAAIIGGGGLVGLLMIKPRREIEKHYDQLDKDHEQITKIEPIEQAMNDLREENRILCYCVLACLKGLAEQGCNGAVHEGISKMETFLNEKAHT